MAKRLVLALFLLPLVAGLSAGEERKEPRKPTGQPAIIYGDYCESAYGYCTREMTVEEAANALRVFFGKRGFQSVVRAHMGRFVRADIYRGPHLVDSIILDRKTGKMRSIY
jgi:hypothetical protein